MTPPRQNPPHNPREAKTSPPPPRSTAVGANGGGRAMPAFVPGPVDRAKRGPSVWAHGALACGCVARQRAWCPVVVERACREHGGRA